MWELREGNIRRMRKLTRFVLVTYMEGKKHGYMIWWVKPEGKSLIEKPRLRRKILYL